MIYIVFLKTDVTNRIINDSTSRKIGHARHFNDGLSVVLKFTPESIERNEYLRDYLHQSREEIVEYLSEYIDEEQGVQQ